MALNLWEFLVPKVLNSEWLAEMVVYISFEITMDEKMSFMLISVEVAVVVILMD